MTRAQFLALGFDYHPPTGDPLRWRMNDVRVYCLQQAARDGMRLFAHWRVGEPTYQLSTSSSEQGSAGEVLQLPMHNAARLAAAVHEFFVSHGGLPTSPQPT